MKEAPTCRGEASTRASLPQGTPSPEQPLAVVVGDDAMAPPSESAHSEHSQALETNGPAEVAQETLPDKEWEQLGEWLPAGAGGFPQVPPRWRGGVSPGGNLWEETPPPSEPGSASSSPDPQEWYAKIARDNGASSYQQYQRTIYLQQRAALGVPPWSPALGVPPSTQAEVAAPKDFQAKVQRHQ